MKGRQLIDIMSLVDDKYVSESDPQRLKQIMASKPPSKFKWSTFFVAAACFLLALNIAIFVPLLTRQDPTVPPVTSGSDDQNEGSTTQSSGINQVQNPSADSSDKDPSSPGDTNIVDSSQLISALDKLFESSDGLDTSGAEKVPFESVNSMQDSSLLQGDIVKITDTHIFYLRGKELYVYSIEKQALVSMISLSGYLDEMLEYSRALKGGYLPSDTENDSAYTGGWKMHLSKDNKSLVIIATPQASLVSGVFSFDISRMPTVTLKNYRFFAGSYVYSQEVDGELLLFTHYQVRKGYNKDKKASYMPFYYEGGEQSFADNIFFPSDITTSAYIMVSRLDGSGKNVLETSAYLSFSSIIHASGEYIVLSRPTPAPDPVRGNKTAGLSTELAIIQHGKDGLVHCGAVTVDGYIKNGDCINIQGNEMCVTATTFVPQESEEQNRAMYETSVSLFVIDLSSMQITARSLNFAPLGHSLHNVIYKNQFAYVYTSYLDTVAESIIALDLSNSEGITVSQITKEAASLNYLISLGNGYGAKICVGSNSQSLNVEIYKGSGISAKLVCSYELTNTYYPEDPFAYYINSSSGLIGFAVRAYTQGSGYQNKYLLLRFDGKELNVVFNNEIDFSSRDTVRACYFNEFFYVITDTNIFITKITK